MAKSIIDDVPASLRDSVAFSVAVCSDCENCPGVHQIVDGGVIISNDADLAAPAVLLTEDQWEELKDHIRSGRIE